VAAVDLTAGRPYLDADWGYRSICDWARLKFQIKLTLEELDGKTAEEIKPLLHGKVMELYHQKEVEFPVKVAMARFMADQRQAAQGGQRYDRDGLFQWTRMRFGAASESLSEEDFRTQSRHHLQEKLLDISRNYFPRDGQEQIDQKLEETFSGTTLSEPDDARELVEWARITFNLEIAEAHLTGITTEAARQVLWNAFDARYRPEMKGMERSLVLNQLDVSWKNHLYTMDHLRSTVGLRGYAQEDPKTVYKREGMKEFDTMWEGVQDKISEIVFRMEEEEAFQESVWSIGAAIHESAPRPTPSQEISTNGAQSDKKPEPIRNRGERVGRNDPCPCGSGKKYKNCHMRQAS
jgi:preprotein translocase subunit SecA